MEMGMLTITLGQAFLYIRESAVKKVEFASMWYTSIILRSPWCDIVLNAHAPTDDKSDDIKNSVYEELEHIFDQFPKYHTNWWSGMKVYIKLVMVMGVRICHVKKSNCHEYDVPTLWQP